MGEKEGMRGDGRKGRHEGRWERRHEGDGREGMREMGEKA